jgi:hypothetical protein
MGGETVGGHHVGDAGAAVVELLDDQAGVERGQPGTAKFISPTSQALRATSSGKVCSSS